MREYKIVVLGEMGAGKSTLVQALAQGRAVSTEVRNTDPAADKAFTTVALDYGDIDLPGGDRLRLYGTPGQARFDFLWPILLDGASGAIVLINADAGPPAQQALPYLAAIEGLPTALPVVMGVTRMDAARPARRAACEQWLACDDGMLPIVIVDPRDPMQVLTVMDVLMSQIECQTLVACDE